jgi:hypothetical protein
VIPTTISPGEDEQAGEQGVLRPCKPQRFRPSVKAE